LLRLHTFCFGLALALALGYEALVLVLMVLALLTSLLLLLLLLKYDRFFVGPHATFPPFCENRLFFCVILLIKEKTEPTPMKT